MTVDEVLERIRAEVRRSTSIYGDWGDYSVDRMVDTTIKEVDEFVDAGSFGDVTGPHGMFNEGIQAASCFVKLLVQLSEREVSGV